MIPFGDGRHQMLLTIHVTIACLRRGAVTMPYYDGRNLPEVVTEGRCIHGEMVAYSASVKIIVISLL